MFNAPQIKKIEQALKNGKRIVDVHNIQPLIYDAKYQHKVLVAGSGLGKTVLMGLSAFKYLISNPGTEGVIISPTENQGYRNLFNILKQIWYLLKENDINTKKSGISVDFYKSGEIHFRIPVEKTSKGIKYSTSILYLLSGFDPDRVRGLRISFLGIDEVSSMDNQEELWETLQGRLMPNYEVLIISTPSKNRDMLYTFYEWGDESNEDKHIEGWKSWSFPTISNNTVDYSKIVEKAKKKMSPEAFAIEYEGKFKDFTGSSLSRYFSRDYNIVNWELFNDKPICLSTDFNLACMTTIAFQVVTKEDIINKYSVQANKFINADNLQDEVMFVYKDFKYPDQETLIPEFCIKIADWLKEINFNVTTDLYWYGDPRGIAKTVNSTRNISTGEISNSWRTIQDFFPTAVIYNDKFDSQMDRAENFISKLSNYLGKTGILINSDCTDLIKDIEKSKFDYNNKGELIGINKRGERTKEKIGHLFDCISYAVSYLWDSKEITTKLYTLG